ncbi:MAG: AmmeMemoRadiSam system protein B [Sedimenticolaceae bacterium]|nr:AmmeMemoRadiSam system protein B [Sedimenticolaceae bacterium]
MLSEKSAQTVRSAAVAGMFYPADAHELASQIDGFLEHAEHIPASPKAMIVPHAGYIYSGPVAASAYAALGENRHSIRRVVLVGPDHRVGFRGIAAPSADWFETPLGRIPVDQRAIDELDGVERFDRAHLLEHSLEVHLPFLQRTLDAFTLVPLVIGQADPAEVAAVLEQLWGGDETLIVVSSDLSHYHDYDTASRIDSETTRAIEAFKGSDIGPQEACGYIGVRGLLTLARQKGLREKTVDLRNSGDTAGPRDQVVGYGAYLFY